MNIYEQYSNSNNKSMFFRDLKEIKDKIELWKNMNNSDRKSLLSWLSIKEINKFLLSLSSNERRKVYEYMDKNKIKGIYKSLSDNEKKEMISLLDDRLLELISDKKDVKNDIDKVNEDIRIPNKDIAKDNENIINPHIDASNIKEETKNNKVLLRNATREEKNKYRQMLNESRSSIFDKIGVIDRYRANKLASITEEYKELSSVVNGLKKEMIDLNNDDKNIFGRKLYGQKASNKVMKTMKIKNRNSIIIDKESIEKAIPEDNYIDNKSDILNAIDKVSGMGVSFDSLTPASSTVNFNDNNKRDVVNSIDSEQLLKLCSTMSNNYKSEMKNQMSMQDMQDQGYSRVRSKGNVSILLLAGIIIMLLCMYFFII